MALFSVLRPTWNPVRLSGLVDRVTARAQNAVWRRVSDRVPRMSIHEARGYIRARAAAVIAREMGILIAEEPTLRREHREQIAVSVRHRIVRRLLFENLRRIEVPLPHRRAAA